MSRKRPENRLQDIVTNATDMFIISRGYKRTQMADIARAVGVSPGTLYLQFESKEALFDFLLRQEPDKVPDASKLNFPLPTPVPGETLTFLRKRLQAAMAFPYLHAAIECEGSEDVKAELSVIVREIYSVLYANRRAIKLADTASMDYPELAEVWFSMGRDSLMMPLLQYIDRRTREGYFHVIADSIIVARIVLEICTFWAVHRHWDPHPQLIDDQQTEDAALKFVIQALLKER